MSGTWEGIVRRLGSPGTVGQRASPRTLRQGGPRWAGPFLRQLRVPGEDVARAPGVSCKAPYVLALKPQNILLHSVG